LRRNHIAEVALAASGDDRPTRLRVARAATLEERP
jgi:hypothetical protein